MALRKLGRLRDAITAYDELEKIAPRHSQLFFNRANAYRDLGDKEAAIRDFTRAIEVTDEPEKVFLNRGNIYLSLRRFELATKRTIKKRRNWTLRTRRPITSALYTLDRS